MGDTIAGVATPPGTGGIGVVRLSGGCAREIAGKVFRPSGNRNFWNICGYNGIYGHVFDSAGDFDEAVAFLFLSPHSYTGEDVVEISCHGGIYIVQRLLRACLDAGAVPAAAGEFTRRAFEFGKITLTEAEAVMELVASKGGQMLRAALGVREGALSEKISSLTKRIIAVAAEIAAWIDFPEEDVEIMPKDRIIQSLTETSGELKNLLENYDKGKVFKHGIETVIAGKPNVGKSSLMNLLAGYDKSIVSNIAGTTRDIVETQVRIGDITLNISDTAGIRETHGAIEIIGVDLAKKRIAVSDLVLAVFDNSDCLDSADIEIIGMLNDKNAIAVINKSDLVSNMDKGFIEGCFKRVVEISVRNETGIQELQNAIEENLKISDFDAGAALLINERQRNCAVNALKSLDEGIRALVAMQTFDVAGVCIDEAIDSLLTLTGERATNEVVNQVFEKFCVGK